MTLYEQYNLVNFIVKSTEKGRTLTVVEFEDLYNRRQVDYFQEQYRMFEANTANTDILRLFKTLLTQSDISIISNSYFALPSNYFHFSSISYIDSDGKYYPFDMVTKDQVIMRKSSTLTIPSTTYPICYEFNNNLYLEPYSSTLNINFQYLRYPNNVVLDYYINTNGEVVYLEEGQGINWDDGDTDSEGGEHSDGSFSASGSYQYTSLTTESEWNEDDQFKIIEYILRDVGVSMNEQGVYQFANVVKNES
jgi:hypothetical protein